VRLRTDERGVTVQIGTVLLFAVLIVLLSTYQATVVPQQNEQVEFNHNQRVQGQMQDLRDGLLRTGATGSGSSTSVALGTQYPVRAVFVNPAPPSGSLKTTPPANVTLLNATGVGETGDYWDGSARNFSTRGLVYDPVYHVYQNPPTTVYEHGVLYNRFESANRTLAGQSLVRENRISLVAVTGSLSESGSGSATVDFQPVSPATRTVTVRNETSNLSVVVPTTRPASEWRSLLADELNQSEGDDRHVLAVEDVSDRAAVRIVLEPGTYELELAKVGVGTDVTGVEPHYVTDVRGDNSSVAENSTRKLVLEVRDRYNNPVSGATVNVSLVENDLPDTLVSQGKEAGEDGMLRNLTTNANGRVTLTYLLDSFDRENQEFSVRVSRTDTPSNNSTANFDSELRETALFTLTAQNTDGSGGSVGTSGTEEWSENETTKTLSASGGLWTNISNAEHVNMSTPRFSPLTGKDGQVKTSERYFRVSFIIENSSRKYVFVIPKTPEGMKYTVGDDKFGSKGVVLLRESEDGTVTKLLQGKKLSASVLDPWHEGNRTLDVLDEDNYKQPSAVKDELDEVRSFMQANENVTLFVTDMHGRVRIAVE
jgi:hypothetical protein